VAVTGAHVHDRDGARRRLAVLRHKCSRWRHSWAEGAYAGPLGDWGRALPPQRPIRVDMTTRSDRLQGGVVLPTRWIVERTLGWLKRYRRLSQDDDYHTETSEAMIQVAMIHVMVRRLARIIPYETRSKLIIFSTECDQNSWVAVS
jgi:putative transposase